MTNAIGTQQERTTTGSHAAPLDDFRVLVAPGLHGSDAGHWQSRWERLYPKFERVEQDRWDAPDLSVWSQRLHQVLQRDARPALIVAHSFGCLTTVHCAVSEAGTKAHNSDILGALLVAPADPDKFNVADAVRARLPFPSLVVGSDNDPWMTAERAAYWAKVWGSDFINIGAVGHINAESGLGDWREGQDLLTALAARIKGNGREHKSGRKSERKSESTS